MKRRFTARRIGCALLFIPWLICMLSPCAIIAMISNGEIKLTYSDLPEDAFRIWLLESTAARGFGISNARKVQAAGGLTCTVTDINFLIWQGSAEKAGAKPARSCACYQGQTGSWALASTGPEACAAAGITIPGTPAP